MNLFKGAFPHSCHAVTIILVFLSMVYVEGKIAYNERFINLAKFGSLGFFIFASHMLIAAEVKTATYLMVYPVSDVGWLLCYIVDFAILVAVPSCIYFGLNRLFPQLICLMTGQKLKIYKS